MNIISTGSNGNQTYDVPSGPKLASYTSYEVGYYLSYYANGIVIEPAFYGYVFPGIIPIVTIPDLTVILALG
jgi:hypothetical protein